MLTPRSPLARRGLTLIELTVVLLVLSAVAGIVIPRITGYLGRAHGAAGASNIGETAKAIGLFEVNNAGNLPDRWDALTDSAAGGGAVVTGIGVDGTDVLALSVGDGGEQALLSAGITTLLHFANDGAGAYDGDNATYDPYDGGATTPGTVSVISDTSTTIDTDDGAPSVLAGLSDVAIARLGLQGQAGDYVVLGCGSQCSLIGNGVVDAPVDFPEGEDTPLDSYRRFLAVLRVSADGGASYFERAKLSTVAAIDDAQVTTLGDHSAEYFEAAEQAAAN